MATKILTVCLLVLAFTSLLVAQPQDASQTASKSEKWKYKGEVFGTIGLGKFNHGDTSLGEGLLLGGGFGVRPFAGKLRGFGFELIADHVSHSIQTSPTHSTEGNVVTVTGSALYHFSDSMAQPYLKGGVGILKADYTSQGYSDWYDDGGQHHEKSWSQNHTDTKFAVTVGAGLKVRLKESISIRSEASLVDTTPGSGYNWTLFRLTVGVGFHF